MWSDNETTEDLLGFSVHADLIRSIVTDPKCCQRRLVYLAIGEAGKRV